VLFLLFPPSSPASIDISFFLKVDFPV